MRQAILQRHIVFPAVIALAVIDFDAYLHQTVEFVIRHGNDTHLVFVFYPSVKPIYAFFIFRCIRIRQRDVQLEFCLAFLRRIQTVFIRPDKRGNSQTFVAAKRAQIICKHILLHIGLRSCFSDEFIARSDLSAVLGANPIPHTVREFTLNAGQTAETIRLIVVVSCAFKRKGTQRTVCRQSKFIDAYAVRIEFIISFRAVFVFDNGIAVIEPNFVCRIDFIFRAYLAQFYYIGSADRIDRSTVLEGIMIFVSADIQPISGDVGNRRYVVKTI